MSSRIYAAEDDDNIREILRCTLESYGYEVEVFESAAPMLERMRQQLPDLVLMDIMMPEMDGMEALRRMKESAQTREVPVIFLTAKSSEVDKVRGLDLGAEDYITKPFGLLELAARVRAARRNTGSTGSPAGIWSSTWITMRSPRADGTWISPSRNMSCCASCSPTAAGLCPGTSCSGRSGALTLWARPAPWICISKPSGPSSMTMWRIPGISRPSGRWGTSLSAEE